MINKAVGIIPVFCREIKRRIRFPAEWPDAWLLFTAVFPCLLNHSCAQFLSDSTAAILRISAGCPLDIQHRPKRSVDL